MRELQRQTDEINALVLGDAYSPDENEADLYHSEDESAWLPGDPKYHKLSLMLSIRTYEDKLKVFCQWLCDNGYYKSSAGNISYAISCRARCEVKIIKSRTFFTYITFF